MINVSISILTWKISYLPAAGLDNSLEDYAMSDPFYPCSTVAKASSVVAGTASDESFHCSDKLSVRDCGLSVSALAQKASTIWHFLCDEVASRTAVRLHGTWKTVKHFNMLP